MSKRPERYLRELTPFTACCLALFLAPSTPTVAQVKTASDASTGLPVGSELDAQAIDNPREIFHSQASRGHKSYLSNLGNLAFNSPYILGATAQKAHISCATCHVNGASNPRLFIPGLSTRPGNFDTTSPLFNRKADNGVLDPVTIPSLRGARFLGPYGHDGRISSLHEFVRNVIVNEFAGPVPSAQILDAIVVYVEDIDFLPNPNLDRAGRLTSAADPAQRRGEVLFSRPFPRDPALSCAGCHVPSSAFVDNRRHDIGSGGLFKTPTLINADFNAPYFHDGRFDNFDQVVAYFDRTFELGLSAQDRADLGAYLVAIGNGIRPQYHLTGTNVLADIDDLASVLDIAIADRDREVIALSTRSLQEQLRDLSDHYPEAASTQMREGLPERTLARKSIATLMATLQRLGSEAAAGHYEAAAAQYLAYRKVTVAAAPLALQSAEPYSLFNPTIHAAHQAAVQQTQGMSLTAASR